MADCMNKKLDETHRYISDHDIETNLNATKIVIEKYPDGHDDNDIKTDKEWSTQSYFWKGNENSSGCLK